MSSREVGDRPNGHLRLALWFDLHACILQIHRLARGAQKSPHWIGIDKRQDAPSRLVLVVLFPTTKANQWNPIAKRKTIHYSVPRISTVVMKAGQLMHSECSTNILPVALPALYHLQSDLSPVLLQVNLCYVTVLRHHPWQRNITAI